MTDYPDSTARTMAQIRKEGSYFARRAAESEAKRERIVAEVARTAGSAHHLRLEAALTLLQHPSSQRSVLRA
ncbi:hypothetical protein, partial [Mycolicibacterium poriferae]|uniref:hypothetical protein n=1 Tax=Mycolicibacterium poriferae TaxID=39694 RepID=UPI0024BBA20D